MDELVVPFNHLPDLWGPHLQQLQRTVTRVLKSGRFLLGAETEKFEGQFADYCETSHCIAVANGTDALEMALRSLGCGPGKEVILAANAGGYASVACQAVGATPVYVDVLDESLLLDPDEVVASTGPRTAAIVATHLYGNVADVPSMRSAGVPIVEDCAQAHGASLNGTPVGTLGDVAAFSFYPTKNLGAIGDAGAVLTSDITLAKALRSLRQYGWSTRYQAERYGGRNSRMDELQAAVLADFMPILSKWNQRRDETHSFYVDYLSDRVPFVVPTTPNSERVVHLSVIKHPDRDKFISSMRAFGVGCETHFPAADYNQAAFPNRTKELPSTDRGCRDVVSLPCHPGLTDVQVEHVAKAAGKSL